MTKKTTLSKDPVKDNDNDEEDLENLVKNSKIQNINEEGFDKDNDDVNKQGDEDV